MGAWAFVKELLGFGVVEKTADNLLDKDKGILVKIGGYVNDLTLTDEERRKYAREAADASAKFVASTLGESTVRSRTRRSIALDWIRVELFLVLAGVTAYPYDKEYAAFIFAVATCNLMFWGTCSVIAFFFGGYYMNHSDVVEAVKKKLPGGSGK